MTAEQDRAVHFDQAALDRLKAANLPHMRASDIAKAKDDTPEAQEQLRILDEYLKAFTPSSDGNCICCGARQGAATAMDAFLGAAYFRWGLVHGEGECSRCSYPARAMHYIGKGEKEMCIRNLILQYHPDGLYFDPVTGS